MTDKFIEILKEELILAQGCTEPIAVALCAAKAVDTLSKTPKRLEVAVSSNIIKNVKSVIVPNTDGQKGIDVAAVFGAFAGDADKELQVLTDITDEKREKALEVLGDKSFCKVKHLKSKSKLHIIITAYCDDEYASVEIVDKHTNIKKIVKNGEVVFEKSDDSNKTDKTAEYRKLLSVEAILDFAKSVELDKVRDIIERQIKCNKDISTEGLCKDYGVNVGKTLLNAYGDDVKTKIKAAAAAGSDARMSGSLLPVVINSGSGNQGLTVSMPVIVYATEIGASDETLIRALLISNLVAIHQKTKIGRLSAYCGAVSAATGSIAAIAWLDNQDISVIQKTITNTIANVSGIICDGAKASCAAKIASSMDAALMGYELAKADKVFLPGDGIVKDNIEQTILGVGDIASKGMVQTDDEIINIMIK